MLSSRLSSEEKQTIMFCFVIYPLPLNLVTGILTKLAPLLGWSRPPVALRQRLPSNISTSSRVSVSAPVLASTPTPPATAILPLMVVME